MTPRACLPFLALVSALSGQITVDRGIPAGHGTLTSNYTAGGSQNQFNLEAQPFVTPDATHVQLDEFSFHYLPNASFPANSLEVVIVEWYPSNATEQDPHSVGTPIWSSTGPSTSVTTINTPTATNPYGGTSWYKYTFATGGLLLDSSKTYAWILMQSATADSGNNQSGAFAFAAAVPTFEYEGKAFASTVPWNYTTLENGTWGGTANYLAYAATFSAVAVPEPSAFGACAGLCALGLLWFRRARNGHSASPRLGRGRAGRHFPEPWHPARAVVHRDSPGRQTN